MLFCCYQMVTFLFLLLLTSATAQLSVDFAAAPLRTDYVGVSAVRHGFDYFPEETTRGLTDSLRELSYPRLSASRLS